MKRRTFLQTSGALAATGMAGCVTTEMTRLPHQPWVETDAMRIDPKRLERRNQNRSTVTALHGMACTSQPLATLTAIDTMRAGGNAIDGAIAANAMLSLVEPMNCGPGGDLFAIVWIEKEQRLFGLNASGRSPYAWNLDEARKRNLTEIPGQSPLAWTVPGCVSGWKALQERFGALKPAEVFAPTIQTAREGFPVSPIIARDWGFDVAKHPTLAAIFAPDGRTPVFGEVFQNPDLASFYELLARDGLDAFYHGEPVAQMVQCSNEQGGLFSHQDFADHTADWVEPVSTGYRGYDVWEIPPNGQGISVLQMLNMLEQFEIGKHAPNSAEQLHLFIEAKKLAYEDRARYYADPAFAEVPTEWLVSKEYGAERAALIDPRRASKMPLPGEFDRSDTIYLTTADSEGNMVSLIQSTYGAWGARIAPAGLGFYIQNRGSAFALDPAHRNRLEPHKRPFHTIIPAFVTRGGRPVFSFGVMGGAFQPQGHVQVLMNLIDYGMSPQQAGEQPRVEHGGSSDPDGTKAVDGGSLRFEQHMPENTLTRLAKMGHTIDRRSGAFGGYQGIWREEDPRRYFGGTDPRKDGCAIGY